MTSFLFLLAFSRKSMRNSSASRRFCGVVNWGGAKTDVQAASKSPILNILKIQNFSPEFNDHTPSSKFYLFCINLKSCDWCFLCYDWPSFSQIFMPVLQRFWPSPILRAQFQARWGNISPLLRGHCPDDPGKWRLVKSMFHPLSVSDRSRYAPFFRDLCQGL